MRILRYSKRDDSWNIDRWSWKKMRWTHWISTRRGIINTINHRYGGSYMIYKKHE